MCETGQRSANAIACLRPLNLQGGIDAAQTDVRFVPIADMIVGYVVATILMPPSWRC